MLPVRERSRSDASRGVRGTRLVTRRPPVRLTEEEWKTLAALVWHCEHEDLMIFVDTPVTNRTIASLTRKLGEDGMAAATRGVAAVKGKG